MCIFFNSLNIPECVYIYTYMQSLLRFFYVIINKYYEKEWKVNIIYNNHTKYLYIGACNTIQVRDSKN